VYEIVTIDDHEISTSVLFGQTGEEMHLARLVSLSFFSVSRLWEVHGIERNPPISHLEQVGSIMAGYEHEKVGISLIENASERLTQQCNGPLPALTATFWLQRYTKEKPRVLWTRTVSIRERAHFSAK
jgi:hypothetical protein